MKLKRLCRNAYRLVHGAAMICYQTAVPHLVLAPTAMSLISTLTDVAWTLTSPESELKHEYDIALLLELEVCTYVRISL